tara:strand:+ start:84 stop:437 length:354 start_codon:yes stop_codon:yes gene_type:complete
MAKEDIKKHQFKKGQSGNLKGRRVGSKNRSTIAKKWLKVESKVTNPLSGVEEYLTQEDIMTLAMIKKGRNGDVPAYKAVNDSAYGQPKETLDVNADAPSIDFRKLFNFTNDSGTNKD